MRWYFAIAIFLFGLIALDVESLKWGTLGVFLYLLPMILQLTKSKVLHVFAIWGGVFLILQSFLTFFIEDQNFKTLPPNMNEIVNIKSGVRGISGKQVITTDSKGFRVTKNIDYKNKAVYRIFVIGGSTAEQLFLDDKSTWPHLLQDSLFKSTGVDVEVINTGVSGLRAIHHLATLRKIVPMHPDLAIFLVGINDWNKHITNTFNNNEMDTNLFSRKELMLRNTLLGKLINVGFSYVSRLVRKPKIINEYGYYFDRGSLKRPNVVTFQPKNVSKNYSEALFEISAECKRNKLKCLFITQPSGYYKGATEEFKNDFWMTPPKQDYTVDFDSLVKLASLYNSYLIKFARDNGHYICDPASKLSPTVENFQDDTHFSKSGSVNMGVIVNACVIDVVKQAVLIN